MNNRIAVITVGLGALSLALIALPSSSASRHESQATAVERLEQKIEEMQARLQEKLTGQQDKAVALALAKQGKALQQLEKTPMPQEEDFEILLDNDGASWLGVETRDVTPEVVKDLKLSAERGVVLGKIVPDSPAAKAGLKENDVITEINGQRVEGAAQFRRMIQEIPAGRTVSLTVWRDAHTQTISVTLAKAEERHHTWVQPTPGTFAFHMPEFPAMPEVAEIPMVPDMGEFNFVFPGAHPRMGIDAEDLNGQLGAYFGVPEDEGVLVREVNPGSAAQKAGVKAGDVITSLNGQRIRSVGDLREKLAEKNDEKTAKLGLLRNKTQMTLTLELPPPPQKQVRKLLHRTNI